MLSQEDVFANSSVMFECGRLATSSGDWAAVSQLHLQEASSTEDTARRHWRMLAAADAHGEYAVACGLVLSAILGFFFDFDGDLDYHSAAGLAYAACISWATFLLCRGVVRAALFRGQMTYTSRDVDFFVFVHKCYNFETGFHNASTLFCLTESLPLLVAAAFIKFHATAVEEEDELWQPSSQHRN